MKLGWITAALYVGTVFAANWAISHIGFVPVGFGLLALDHESNVLTLFPCIVVFDGFSQLFGQLFGKMKLLPSVSPEKTIEGFLGGLLMVVPVFWWLQPEVTLLYAILCSVVFAVVALSGDLLASKFKRICGVKDYSRLLPGHGGSTQNGYAYIKVFTLAPGEGAPSGTMSVEEALYFFRRPPAQTAS